MWVVGGCLVVACFVAENFVVVAENFVVVVESFVVVGIVVVESFAVNCVVN